MNDTIVCVCKLGFFFVFADTPLNIEFLLINKHEYIEAIVKNYEHGQRCPPYLENLKDIF